MSANGNRIEDIYLSHCSPSASAFYKKRKRAGCRRTRLNIAKVNSKVTRISDTSKQHRPNDAECCTLEHTTLDTNRNNCTDADCQAVSVSDTEQLQVNKDVRWAGKARRKFLSHEVVDSLIQYTEDRIRTIAGSEPTSERPDTFYSRLSHDEWKRNLGTQAFKQTSELAKWLKRYQASAECCRHGIQSGREIHFLKCRQRWCITCNRTRAAKAARLYKEYLESLPDPYFLTLTLRKEAGRGHRSHELRGGISEMQKIWQRIRAKLKRLGFKLRGFKKIESTYNIKGDWFHPHYHMIISGEKCAKAIRAEWIKQLGGRAGKRGQRLTKIKPNAKAGAIREVLKYCFKDAKGGELIPPHALHAMNEAFFGKRTHDALGFRKVQAHELEPAKHERLQAPNEEYPTYKVFTWDADAAMWMHGCEPLFNWWPSEKVARMVVNSRVRRGVLNSS